MRIWKPALAASCGVALFTIPPAFACELLAPGIISTGLKETSAAFAPDGNTVYFVRSDASEVNDTILVSHLENGRWKTPRVASFSGRWHDSGPAQSPSGKRLYFVSNRPVHPGDAPLTISVGGKQYPGTNLWYVERQPDGNWGKPVHVDGTLNNGAMLYHPTVAENENIYFSAHRKDSGKFYQIYVVRPTKTGYTAPQRLDLGNVKHNRMDPSIAPNGRFLVYAGNEGDSTGSADIYIVFRQKDGSWNKPERLAGDVNSGALENSPTLGQKFGVLYVSSQRHPELQFPKNPRDNYTSLQTRLQSPLNGSRNIWRCNISALLHEHGINH